MWRTSLRQASPIYSRAHTESRRKQEIPDNHYEALGPNEGNLKKIIIFLKDIDMCKLI